MTTPEPEIVPFTAQELDDLESRLALRETCRPTVLMSWDDSQRLFAGSRQGLQAEQWKNAADLAQRERDEAKQQLAGLAGHGPEAPTMVENRNQYGMLMLTNRQPTSVERMAWKAISVDGVLVKNAYGECGLPPSNWAEVTRQLGERVARLEAVGQLLDVKTASCVDGEECADREQHSAPVVRPPTFADIGKSPGFQQVATEGLMRDLVRTDAYLKRLLGPEEYEVMQRRLIMGGPPITSAPADVQREQPDLHVLGEEAAVRLLRAMLDERATPEYVATIMRSDRVDVQVVGRSYLLCGPGAITVFELIRKNRPSRDHDGCLALLIEMLGKRLVIRHPDDVAPTDLADDTRDSLSVALGYAPGSIDWQRGLDLVRETIKQRNEARAKLEAERQAANDGTGGRISHSAAYWAEEWETRIALRPVPLSLSECLHVVEADMQEAMQTVAGLKLDNLNMARRRVELCTALGIAADAHGSDWESLVGQVDRLQRAHALRAADRADVEAGSKWIAELQDKLTETERQLANARADNLNIRATREAIARRLEAAETHNREMFQGVSTSLGRLGRGDSAGWKDLIDAIRKLKRDVEMARADREQAEQDAEASSTMNARAERQRAEAGAQRDAALAALASIAYMLRVERGEHVGQTRDRIVAKLDELLAAPKLEATPKHEDLARRIRESDYIQAFASWQGDGDWLREATDGDLLDQVFARLNHADRLEGQLGGVMGLVHDVLADTATPKERVAAGLERARAEGRREADVERAALVAKLQLVREAVGATLQPDGTDDVVDKARASASRGVPEILDRELEWFSVAEAIAIRLGIPANGTPGVAREVILGAVSKLQHDLETERKVHAHSRDLLSQSNADHNALLVQLHRIRAALRIEVDTPWLTVADRAIGCVRIADEEGRWEGEHDKVKHQLDSYLGTIEGEHSPRPGHARVTIHLWSSAADTPSFDSPDYGLIIELGTETLSEFRMNAARNLARLLAKWGQPGVLPTSAGSSRQLRLSVGPDPGRFSADLATIVTGSVDAKLGSALPPLPGLPRPPALLASEQILREVITAAMASGPSPADVFEVRHRPAGAETPPRTELHVFAGKGPMTATTQVLAYVELGALFLIAVDGRSYHQTHSEFAGGWCWPERIRAALDRK